MGVRGLMTFITENSDLYMDPFELSDSYLVIDGNSLYCQLFASESHVVYGGEYDKYCYLIRDFFLSLQRCNVTPIVVFDGGREKKKLRTIFRRASTKITIIEAINQGKAVKGVFPLFASNVFLNVIKDLNCVHIQADFEADEEIAAIAKALNCPVLSNDSDFFIYDVLLVPIWSLNSKPMVRKTSAHKNRFFIQCSMYKMSNLLRQFSGLEKSHFPIIATLMGNDYIDNNIFKNFFKHVIISKNKNLLISHRRVLGLLNWIKKESFHSAVQGILNHVKKSSRPMVSALINSNIKNYNEVSVSQQTYELLNKILTDIKKSCYPLSKKKSEINLPLEMRRLFNEGEIHPFVMDFISLGMYFTGIQVEDLSMCSTHILSIPLIKIIKSVVHDFCAKDILKCYIIHKHKYQSVTVENLTPVERIKFCEIVKMSHDMRVKLFFDTIGFDERIVQMILLLGDAWSLYFTACLYWIKSAKDSITFNHVSALLLTAVAIQVVQKSVGYFTCINKFNKKYRDYLNTDKKPVDSLHVKEINDFGEMLKRVSQIECILVQKQLIPMRQPNSKDNNKISTVHLFNTFQSCLFHIIQVNVIFNYPLKKCKISDFYSGILLYNMYVQINKALSPEQFCNKLLNEAPNIKAIYLHLTETVKSFASVAEVKKSRRRRKKKKNAAAQPKEFYNFCTESPDNEVYEDYENPFYGLKLSCNS
ncbi:hypothetical protein RUM43_008275 [Polyplax serrata]|uniref:XPG N-terminal domain-containing protein n=1 Tax=Polyplax serrata TaxID=468196 RepID=A0AAN8PN89_POLSC